MKSILVCDNYTPESLARLNSDFKVTHSKDHHLKPEELADVDGLLIRSRTKIDKDTLKNAPNLKCVVTATSGFDHIDVLACEKQNVVTMHTPEANSQSAAEHTFALILSLVKQIKLSDKVIENGQWKKQLSKFETLEGKNLGIIGFGRVGKKVAAMGKAFGMSLSAYDPYLPFEEFGVHGAESMGLIELIKYADIISLHVPLTKETLRLINQQTLGEINGDALLINASRGKVVCENSLITALDSRRIRGAALDVFIKEPLDMESGLRNRSNVILTPHVGAYTFEATQVGSLDAVDKIMQFFSDQQKVSHSLPPKTDWAKHIDWT